jgi:hypothetical protein
MKQLPITVDAFVPRLGDLLDLAFYASMTTEEAHRATFSIAVAKSDHRVHRFSQPKPLDVKLLRKLSAACHDDGAAVFVWFADTQWFAWGLGLNTERPPRSATTRQGDYHLTITVRDAGAFDVRWQDEVLFTYAEGKADVLGEQRWIANMVKAALPPASADRIAMHHLVAIQRAMRRHGRGGALLVVPTTPDNLKIGYPIQRSIPGRPPGLNVEMHEGPLAGAAVMEESFRRGVASVETEGDRSSNEELIRFATDRTDAEAALIGNLTAIDGIVVIDHAMCVRGFGAKIAVPDGFGTIAVTHVNALDRTTKSTTAGELFAGMRHISAASICVAVGNALALVQSQDGALSVMIAKDGALTVVSPLAQLTDPDHQWRWQRS